MAQRTHACGEVTEAHVGQQIVLKGWVQRRRDLGGLIFVDMRDRTGIIQVVFNPDASAEALALAEKIRNEYVIEVQGEILRDKSRVNQTRKRGKLKSHHSLLLLTKRNPPFAIEDRVEVARRFYV